MVREDILGGLRTALARGQPLKQAMMSFYNAGYLKQEIEEAAGILQQEISNPIQQQFAPGPEASIFQRTGSDYETPTKPKTIQKESAYGEAAKPPSQLSQVQTQKIPQKATFIKPIQQVQPQPVKQQIIQQPVIQRVSAYGQPQQPIQPTQPRTKPKGKAIIFVLIGLLIILVIGLVAVFFFRNEILAFFNAS